MIKWGQGQKRNVRSVFALKGEVLLPVRFVPIDAMFLSITWQVISDWSEFSGGELGDRINSERDMQCLVHRAHYLHLTELPSLNPFSHVE